MTTEEIQKVKEEETKAFDEAVKKRKEYQEAEQKKYEEHMAFQKKATEDAIEMEKKLASKFAGYGYGYGPHAGYGHAHLAHAAFPGYHHQHHASCGHPGYGPASPVGAFGGYGLSHNLYGAAAQTQSSLWTDPVTRSRLTQKASSLTHLN